VICWGAVLCRSPAFRTSGHFVPRDVAYWKKCGILIKQTNDWQTSFVCKRQ